MRAIEASPTPGSLLRLLAADGYAGWTSYEGPGSSDPIRVMQCYRRIWELMTGRG